MPKNCPGAFSRAYYFGAIGGDKTKRQIPKGICLFLGRVMGVEPTTFRATI